jgi:hypothetical protein
VLVEDACHGGVDGVLEVGVELDGAQVHAAGAE